MEKTECVRFRVLILLICAAVAILSGADGYAEAQTKSRYDADFEYQGVYYGILAENDHTVAVAQPYDIDSNGKRVYKYLPSSSWVGENGFIMSYGLHGTLVEIPQTVYDERGVAYTVTALAPGAINYEGVGGLVLPPTLLDLNGGISFLPLNLLYLPEGLKRLSGIVHCPNLKNVTIPWSVEEIGATSLMACGFEKIFLPPNVKTIGDKALGYCDSLYTAALSRVEEMGEGCFRGCASFGWANLPESLKSMGDGCFNDCPELRRVSLPWSEIKMNDCFNGCPAVECIEILAAEPYPFPENCFNDVDRANCDLLVPEESLKKYMQADGWKEFFRINGVLTGNVSVKSVKKDTGFVAVPGNGSLKIYIPDARSIDIVAADGVKAASICKSGATEIPLPAGVYIVASPSSSVKVRIF